MQLDLLNYRAHSPSDSGTKTEKESVNAGHRTSPLARRLPSPPLNGTQPLHSPATSALPAIATKLRGKVDIGLLGWREPDLNIWDKYLDEGLRQNRLSDYLDHPLYSLACLGPAIEPLNTPTLKRYAAQISENDGAVLMAHPSVTAPRYRPGRGYVSRGGKINPHFLNSRYFLTDILRPAQKSLRNKLKLVVLTFPDYLSSTGISAKSFAERLDRFLGAIPKNIRIAIEIRDNRMLGIHYSQVLARHDASHVFTDAGDLPDFTAQRHKVPPAPLLIFRLGQKSICDDTIRQICAHQRVTPGKTMIIAEPRAAKGQNEHSTNNNTEQRLRVLAAALAN